MIAIQNILSVRARQQAAAGQIEAAWRTLMLGLHIADSLQSEPSWTGQLVRTSVLSKNLDAVQSFVKISLPSADDAVRLDKLLKSFESRQPVVHGLDGDRLILGEAVFSLSPSQFVTIIRRRALPRPQFTPSRFAAIMQAHDVPKPLAVLYWKSPIKRWHCASYLEMMRNAARAAAEPYVLWQESEMRKPELTCWFLTEGESACFVPSSPVQMALEWTANGVTRARIIRAGLSLLRYKQEHGTFPADLHAIHLANEDDSYTGRPLVYRASERGFVLHNEGANLSDDKDSKTPPGGLPDVIWRYDEENPTEKQGP